MELHPRDFPALTAARLKDTALKTTVSRATRTSLKKRALVVGELDGWESMRSAAHRIKMHVIDHLPYYLRAFETAATERGAILHYATDAAEARAIILEITRRFGGVLAVKSKSMTTEEIGLAHALIAEGIDTVETDLGEYIVQLAGEIPSHITAPALHKSREDIGRLFTEKLGIPYTSDPEELTKVARQVLREKFLAARVGMSGVNFAVADSGALCVVENEGNARLSMSLPEVHIAVMGVEKLVPDTQSLSLFLSMLARSATGQRLSCYTSLVTGPRAKDEQDGPRELHIVILDNGRTRMLEDPRLKEALLCIRCGACMNVCPVYQQVGGHAYGSIYPGPIGSVLTPVLAGLEEGRYLPFASSLCGNCAEICPVKIDIHHMLLWHRKSIVAQGFNPAPERLAMRVFAWGMGSAPRYRFGLAAARFFSRLLARDGSAIPVPGWSVSRDFPALPSTSFRQRWKEHRKGGEE